MRRPCVERGRNATCAGAGAHRMWEARRDPFPSVMPARTERSDVTELLHTEHAVARVLAAAPGEAEAYPELLAAMGEALGWDFGAVWVPVVDDALRCVATWPRVPTGCGTKAGRAALTLAAGKGCPGACGRRGQRPPGSPTSRPIRQLPRAEAAARAGLAPRSASRSAAPGVLGVIEFFTAAPRDARRRAARHDGQPRRADRRSSSSAAAPSAACATSDARKSAILNAAFDCVVTMDHRRARRRGQPRHRADVRLPRRGDDRPRAGGADRSRRTLREAHRAALRRYMRHRRGRGRRPAGRAARRCAPTAPSSRSSSWSRGPSCPARRCSPATCATSPSAARAEAALQPAGRRAGRAAAGGDRGRGARPSPRGCSALVTEEVGRLLERADGEHGPLRRRRPGAVVGGWARRREHVPVGTRMPLDGDTAAARVWRTGRPGARGHATTA